jgi:aromatic-L-amino-acid/L-tryptophan decarboxylase
LLPQTDTGEPPPVSLTLPPGERGRLFEYVALLADRFIDEVPTLPVSPTVDPGTIRSALAAYDFAAPREARAVFDDCAEWLRRWTVHVTHPRYFGLFNPRPTGPGVAADLLVAAVNPQLAAWSHAPAAVEIERHVIRYIGTRLGLRGAAIAGSFTTGGAEANHSAVLLALTRSFPDFVARGVRALAGQPVIYASEEAHAVLIRIAQLCGLGRAAVHRVPVDAGLRLDVGSLERIIERDRAGGDLPFLVVATAGTTSAGIIDPLAEVADVCERSGLRLHVDAAWAGAIALSDRLRAHLSGIERADSITLDAHKWLSVPMGAGMFLCTDEEGLRQTFEVDTPYMPPPGASPDPFSVSIQWTRRFIGLKLFASLAVAGQPGFAAAIEGQTELGSYLREWARSAGWEVVNATPLPVVCLSHPGVSDYDLLVQRVIERGAAWVSVTRLHGRPVIRICITNVDSTRSDVDVLLAELESTREDCAAA